MSISETLIPAHSYMCVKDVNAQAEITRVYWQVCVCFLLLQPVAYTRPPTHTRPSTYTHQNPIQQIYDNLKDPQLSGA